GSGLISPEALQREAFGEREDGMVDSQVRVALSLLERSGMIAWHPGTGREVAIEMVPPPPTARADLEAMLEARRRHAEARLEEMVRYAEGPTCRHVAIARHFGQQQ